MYVTGTVTALWSSDKLRSDVCNTQSQESFIFQENSKKFKEILQSCNPAIRSGNWLKTLKGPFTLEETRRADEH